MRWEPSRKAAAVVGASVLIVGSLTLWWVRAGGSHPVPVRAAGAPGTAPPSGVPGAGSPARAASSRVPSAGASGSATVLPAAIVVHVAGKVRHPGVYTLPSGARVVDAVTAAGGALPDVDSATLNLAAVLRDGEQIAVGLPGSVASGGQPGSGPAPGGGSAPRLIDLNTATQEQLETLPGVGPVLAQSILDWRDQHGRFTSVDQLNDVKGIGTAKFAQLRSRVTV